VGRDARRRSCSGSSSSSRAGVGGCVVTCGASERDSDLVGSTCEGINALMHRSFLTSSQEQLSEAQTRTRCPRAKTAAQRHLSNTAIGIPQHHHRHALLQAISAISGKLLNPRPSRGAPTLASDAAASKQRRR
jgi:hypothetical protein